jgi:ABC-type transport system involved in multi-copper enzyme maturation permease subunit
MNLPAILLALRWLVWDTVRQAIHAGLFWVMLLVTVLCTVFCLSIGFRGDVPLNRPDDRPEFLPRQKPWTPARAAAVVASPNLVGAALIYEDMKNNPRYVTAASGVDLVQGELSLGFGAMRIPLTRDRERVVGYIQVLLAGWVADTAGLLLTLVWTAGFLPTFLDPGAAAILLAKPVPRWSLLVGKYLGVLIFVLFQAVLFVGGTWVALGISTGVWKPAYLYSIPLLLLHFAIFFSFSVLLAVFTRSTVACVIGSILFWLLCWGLNFGRHMAVLTPEMQSMSGLTYFLMEAAYWIMPKPADMSVLLFDALQADNYFARALDVKGLMARDAFHPDLSVLSSLAFAGVVLAAAAYHFLTTDY